MVLLNHDLRLFILIMKFFFILVFSIRLRTCLFYADLNMDIDDEYQYFGRIPTCIEGVS